MARRILKARIISTIDGQEHSVFVINHSDSGWEVLKLDEESFTFLNFCQKTMVERHGKYLLYILPEDL